MTTCKKVLSLVLCLAMLLGTLTVGFLSVSAAETYDLPTYESLVTKYAGAKFFYAGVELNDSADGSKVTDYVYPGETIDVSFFVKSNHDVYKGIYYLFLDPNMFTFVNNSGVATDTTVSRLQVAKATASAAGCYKTTNKVDTVDPAFADYTVDQLKTWIVIKIQNIDATGNTNQIRNTKGDIALGKFQIKVNETLGTADTGLGCSMRFFNSHFTASSGTAYGNNYCYLDATADTAKLAVSPNFDCSGPRTLKVGNRISFVDSDGETALLPTVLAEAGTKINLDSYVPTAEGKTFKQWSINGVAVKGSVSLDSDITAKAIWEGETPSNSINILIPDGKGNWEVATTVSGDAGTYLQREQINAASSYINANFTFDSGIKDAVVTAGSLSKINAVGTFIEIKGGTEGSNESLKVKFGSTEEGGSGITDLYIPVSFTSIRTYYTPTFKADGTVDEEGWVAHTMTPAEFKTNADGDFVYNNTTFDKYTADFNTGSLGESEIDSNYYSITYVDGNGVTHTAAQNSSYITLTAADVTEGTTNFDIYVTPTFNEFWVSVTVSSSDKIVSRQKVSFDDEIDSDILTSFFSLSAGENSDTINLEDLYEDGKAVGKQGSKLVNLTFSVDGEVVFHTERKDGQTVLLDAEGQPVVITPEVLALKGFKGILLLGGKSENAINFTANWEEKENEFTVMYQDGDNGWKELTKKSFSGAETVDGRALLDEDLKAVINNSYPTGKVAVDNTFTLDAANEQLASNIHAYDGPLTLYVLYTADKVYAYADFNNTRYDENGEVTTPGTAESSGPKDYGTVVYNPDRNIFDIIGEDEVVPYFNSFLITFRPTSAPAVEYKKDSDGNIVYADLQQPKAKLDEEGKPVINPETGEPEYEKDATGSVIMETVMTDELNDKGEPTGNKIPVPDTSKPIIAKDPKGNDSNRPYRNCEYVGWKFYYVEGIYKDWSSVMAKKDEWKEGFENSDYSAKSCTPILQIQWKSDAEFKYRVYDSNGNIYSAKGTDRKTYFWSGDKPCEKSKAAINKDPIRINEEGKLTGQFLLMFSKKTETATYAKGQTGESKYYTTRFIGVANLHPRFLPDLFPTLINLIKGLL